MSLNSSHIQLDDIRLDRVKSRRGRPKGTKKPFWSFSKKTSVANKKERRQRKLKMQAQTLVENLKDNDTTNALSFGLNPAKLIFDQN